MSESVQKTTTESSNNLYFLRDHNVNGSEWDRLDKLHRGFCEYMGGELTFAPLEKPKKILDIGTGSGAWAIQAAQIYDQAEVFATDISPLPSRPLPPNMKYLFCNVLEPLPFEADSFDVVHLRIVLYHLPDISIRSVVGRISQVLKPGGWLVIEDFGKYAGHPTNYGPAQLILDSRYKAMLNRKGLNPLIGEHLQDILQTTNAFSEINIKKIELTLSTGKELYEPLPRERALSSALKSTLETVVMAKGISEDYKLAGITSDLQNAWLEESKDPTLKSFHDVWFTWSRKRRNL